MASDEPEPAMPKPVVEVKKQSPIVVQEPTITKKEPKPILKFAKEIPETKPDSPYFYYVKKPAGGEKAKVKLSAKKYNPDTRKHEMFVEKKLPPHSK